MHSMGLDKSQVTRTQYFHSPENTEGTTVGLPLKKELEPMDDTKKSILFLSKEKPLKRLSKIGINFVTVGSIW